MKTSSAKIVKKRSILGFILKITMDLYSKYFV